MKVSKEALRRIIREAVQAKLEEMPRRAGNDPVELVGGRLGAALAKQLGLDSDLGDQLSKEVWSSIQADVGGDMAVPARYEDLQSWATDCANRAVEELHSSLQDIAFSVLQRMMEPEEAT